MFLEAYYSSRAVLGDICFQNKHLFLQKYLKKIRFYQNMFLNIYGCLKLDLGNIIALKSH